MRRPRSSLRLRIPGRFASMLLSAGCASEPTPGASEADSGMSTTSTSTAPVSTSEPADDTSLATGSDTGSVFLPNPDLGNGSECDYFAQDCSPGLKCMPWGSDGGNWDASKCVPIVEDPAGPDEMCQVFGWGTSGLDDCDLGLYCWYVDPRTQEGRCMPLCLGSEDAPYCTDPRRACDVFADAVIAICRPICDPLEQSCDVGQGCYFIEQAWQCTSDASGDAGAYGDPCEYIDVCDPGLVCRDAAAVPPGLPCEGAAGCCTDLCDVDDPAGDLQCAGVAEGATCHPWYDEDEAPLLFEHVGVCRLPVGA